MLTMSRHFTLFFFLCALCFAPESLYAKNEQADLKSLKLPIKSLAQIKHPPPQWHSLSENTHSLNKLAFQLYVAPI